MASRHAPFTGRTSITEREIAWVAGLLEGEGSFLCLRRNGHATAARVSMQTTDEDIARRLQALTGVGSVTKIGDRPERKPCWQWRAQKRADVVWLVALLLPWLGQRRRRAALEALREIGVCDEGEK